MKILILLIFFPFFTLASASSVTVPKNVVMLSPSQLTSIVTIKNPDKKQTAYIKIEIEEYDAEKLKNGQVSLRKIEGAEVASSILIKPNKLIIPPNSLSNIKLITTADLNNEVDRYFRVLVTPMSNKSFESNNDGLSTAVFFSITKTFFVVTNLNKELSSFTSKVDGTSVVVRNTGDSFFTLNKCVVCLTQTNKCTLFPQKRFVPDREYSFTLAAKHINSKPENKSPLVELSCDFSDGYQTKEITFSD